MVDIYKQIAWLEEDQKLRSGKEATFQFQADREEVQEKRHRLFFRGENTLFYMWKSEPDCTGEYLSIEDSLNREKAQKDAYCLDLSSETEVVYRKSAFKKIDWRPSLSYLPILGHYTDEWQWGVLATAKNLKFYNGGYVKFHVEIFYKDSVQKDIHVLMPDEEYNIFLDEGTYNLKEYVSTVCLPEPKIDHIDFFVDAVGYSGELYLERPFLKTEKIPNLLQDFAPIMPGHEKWAWIGVNLSKKEWPKFHITLNGEKVFDGELFERCHRYSEFEFDLPEDSVKEGENTLTIGLDKDYPMDFNIKEVGCFIKDNDDVVLISCPETVSVGGTAKLLLRTKYPNTTVSLKTDNNAIGAIPQTFPEAGFNVFDIACNQPAVDVAFSLESEYGTVNGSIERVVVKEEDGVITGTGDMIYINHEKQEDMDNYLSWFMATHLGDMVTIRNIYRWGGGRRLVPEVWKNFTDLMNKMDMKYVVMNDGRNFPGVYCNPTYAMMEGKGFLGMQGHEFDQGMYSGGAAELNSMPPTMQACYDVWARVARGDREKMHGRHCYSTQYYHEDKIFLDKNPWLTTDMKVGADAFVNSMKNLRFHLTKHSGLTTLYRNMFQAGYDWVSAELLYTTMEVTSAAIRGATHGYGKKGFGAHLATQWSTTPHDDVMHSRRLRVGLYVTYMNGYTDINTEEGYWHMEEYYSAHSRKDKACLEHLKQQQDFFRYIRLNTRKGKFYTPTALMHGRYDGWKGFGLANIWGQRHIIRSTPDDGMDAVMKKFYPLANTDSMIYRHPCPQSPQGYQSGTPMGCIDILPIEADVSKYQSYKNLIFAGYHRAEDEDCEKILTYLKQGGTVMMAWPHLSIVTERGDVDAGNHTFLQNDFTKMLAEATDFVESTVNGKPVHINPAFKTDGCQVVKTTDDGQPLLLKKQVEEGVIWFFNTREYPGDSALMDIFTNLVESCSREKISQESAFVSCDKDVEFTVFDREDGTRDIYLLAVDWYNESLENRKATLRVGKDIYEVGVPFGTMVKVVVKDGVAAWIVSEDAVVLDIADTISVSGTGTHTLYHAKDGKVEKKNITFVECSYQEV